MARASSLPERLRYLQPFRKKFTSRPDDLNEGTGEAPLFALFSKHIKGLSESEAQKLLEDDFVALKEWLSMPEHENDCLQFVRGFLLVSPSEIAKRILEESAKAVAPPPWIEIDLPDGAKVKRVANRTEAAIILRWKGLIVSFDAMSEETAAKFAKILSREHPNSTIVLSFVRFGEVGGTKSVRVTEAYDKQYKEVRYLLAAPGGHILISASPLGKKIDEAKWDESILEALFHTLRVVEKQKSTIGGTN